jgi:hypothetical protein
LLFALFQQREEIAEFIAKLAAALASGRPSEFLVHVDEDMPERGALSANVNALADGWEVSSSVDLIEAKGDDRVSVVLDWVLQVRARQSSRLHHKRSRVECSLRRHSAAWRITTLAPVEFFAPPQV